ncbi:ARM repeat protein interacting with ABF2 [Actinidia rufa]|uniref:ARM repeat protein interacting with ABF2 n=1 Tax=Actinidia rufa TaxID=165716 RepID=A0A7J0G5M9_9ERIC|nr:ARM repeat protein interacting with ABF2 [Actinidia rufa]
MENQKRHEQPTRSARKSLKRKLEEDFGADRKIATLSPRQTHQDLIREIRTQVEKSSIRRSRRSRPIEPLPSAQFTLSPNSRRTDLGLRSLMICVFTEEIVDLIVDSGAVAALVRHLQAPPPLREGQSSSKPHEHEVEKGSAFTLWHLAVKPEHQQLIVDAGALPHLVNLLKRHREGQSYRAVNGVIRRAADAITNLAHENSSIKTRVRIEGGILPLVELLEFSDPKVQRAAAGALRTLAFKNDENKYQVGAIGNLVHSSPNIKKEVLLLQELCNLLLDYLSAHCSERSCSKPLIEMLQSPDTQLREMSAFALGSFLIQSMDPCKHNAAFTLYGLADNEDNVADIIRVGGVQKLQEGEFIVQPTRDCVAKTLKRLEEKIHGRVLSHLLYLMRVAEKVVQRRVALALAHLCLPDDRKAIFIDNNGLELLLELLQSTNLKQQQDASEALYKLATKASSLSPVDAAPPSPTPQKMPNYYQLLATGKRFYAHRICLLASSDAFRAMFDGGYREKDAKDVEIPNIRWDVFELMMRYIYTGSVDVNLDVAQELLRAADQYLLEGLKRLCECAIAQDISVENVSVMYELSEAFNATSLKHACVLFILEKFNKLSAMPWYSHLIQRILPEIRNYFRKSIF